MWARFGAEQMMRIYVAGPYGSIDQDERTRNVERAMVAGLALLERGHMPFIPHLSHFFDQWATEQGNAVPYETYLRWDAAFLEQCDGLLYLDSSPGADRELELAVWLGRPIYSRLSGLPPAVSPCLLPPPGASRNVT
jgi:hypothetical protein